MYLELVEDVRFESDKMECKVLLNRDDVLDWLKSVTGFANADGGELYIGVENKMNKLISFDGKAADNEKIIEKMYLYYPPGFIHIIKWNLGVFIVKNLYKYYLKTEAYIYSFESK